MENDRNSIAAEIGMACAENRFSVISLRQIFSYRSGDEIAEFVASCPPEGIEMMREIGFEIPGVETVEAIEPAEISQVEAVASAEPTDPPPAFSFTNWFSGLLKAK